MSIGIIELVCKYFLNPQLKTHGFYESKVVTDEKWFQFVIKISLLTNEKHKLLFKMQNTKETRHLKIKEKRWCFL